MVYHSTYNVFFVGLPVSSFVFNSSLLTVKVSVQWLHMMASSGNGKFSVILILATLITQLLFQYLVIRADVTD